jgi:hypothetical protein
MTTVEQSAEAERLKHELSQAEKLRLERYNQLKELPQFKMLDKVEIVS